MFAAEGNSGVVLSFIAGELRTTHDQQPRPTANAQRPEGCCSERSRRLGSYVAVQNLADFPQQGFFRVRFFQ